MIYFDKLHAIYDFGGVDMLKSKVCDKLFGTDKFRKDIYRISKSADVEQYPRLLKDIFCFETGEILNLSNPVTYNEKIQWLKLYDSTNLKTTLSDKYLVREWVEERIGPDYLIPLLGVWNSSDDINFEELPDSFVLKCNHGCGYNIVIKDKLTVNYESVRAVLSKWMEINDAFLFGFELQYKNITRRIIAEQYIEQMDGDLLDYKIHVFNGEPKIIHVIGERDAEKHTAKEIFLDTNWEVSELMYHTYEKFAPKPLRPDNIEEMLNVARKLGHGFSYVRVDLYNISGQILFGEMTFTPFSGMGKWDTYEQNRTVGEWIQIEKEGTCNE